MTAFDVTALDSDSNALRSNLSDSVLFEICLLSCRVRLVAGPGDGSMLLCSMYLYVPMFYTFVYCNVAMEIGLGEVCKIAWYCLIDLCGEDESISIGPAVHDSKL